jgi:hypothetical protein
MGAGGLREGEMNWHRVLRRLWVALSALWVVAIVVTHCMTNASNQYLRAEFGPVGYVLFIAAYAIGPPAVIFSMGWTVAWILAGFRR